jgi:hypothetical protein
MIRKFEILLTLNLEHDFYSDKEFTDIEIIPHPFTLKFLRNHRILLKRIGSKYHLIQEGEMENNKWVGIIEVTEPFSLVFQFRVNDVLFQTKTDIVFFANKTSKILIKVNKVSQDIKLLPFLKVGVPLDSSDSSETDLFSIKNSNGEVIEARNVIPGSTDFIVLEEPGDYQVLKNGATLTEVLWSTHDEKYDGFILFNYTGGIKEEYSVVFSTRSIKWRYALKSKYIQFNPSEQDVNFKEEEGRIEFELESEIDGYWHFISKDPVELHDKLDYSFYIEVEGEREFSGIGGPDLSNLYKGEFGDESLMLIKYVTI